MNTMRTPLIYCVVSLLLPFGCSTSPTSVVTGGTEGWLIVGDSPTPDFEVRVFEVGSTNPLGMGVTGIDGNFKLMVPGGDAPLWLSDGEYAITLESIGAASPRMSAAYGNPAKTPLKVKWRSANQTLELKIPAFKQ
jgi:hypothetical protein